LEPADVANVFPVPSGMTIHGFDPQIFGPIASDRFLGII
jgi:hypothetical protein